MAKVDYRSAGVDLDVYQQAMDRLPKWMQRTFSPRVLHLAGGFAGLYQLDFRSPLFRRNYREPVLVAATDGVGTKLKVAITAGKHDTVGIDLVAMSVNDAICCGAEPLFFLDYVAMDRDDPPRLEQIVRGVSDGCLQADCALLGGETAIMPDLYAKGHYDLAGFCVGVVERRQLITGRAIAAGDLVLGLDSNGLHSNGYSLARKAVFEVAGLSLDDQIESTGQSVAETLLQPTRIYVAAVKRILRHYKVKQVVHGIAHITGGGLAENISRILPASVDVRIDRASWQVPPVFRWLQQLADIDEPEMWRVFNMGIGLTLLVSPFYAQRVLQLVQNAGYSAQVIGQVTAGSGQVILQ